MISKYLNADISPERLAKIENEFKAEVFHSALNSNSAIGKIYDLLAMIEVKDGQIDIYDTTLQQMKEYAAELRGRIHEKEEKK